jgi:hypothetical protein
VSREEIEAGLAREMASIIRASVAGDRLRDGTDDGECIDAYNDKEQTDSAVPAPWNSYCGDTCIPCRMRAVLAKIDATERDGVTHGMGKAT